MLRKTQSSSNEIRLQQLRSFCETARLGSLTKAANALGTTQPTVGEQVHSLERELDTQLVVTNGRGSNLTEAGRILAELATPTVAAIDSLKARFREAYDDHAARMVVACSPRTLAEDVLDFLPAFEETFPKARITCSERMVDSVADAVQSKQANLGMTPSSLIDRSCASIEVEEGYELDLLLVTPKNHALAKKSRLKLSDIADYPVVNGADSIPDYGVSEMLIQAGVFDKHPCTVQANYTDAVRRFVSRGFGVGFVFGLPGYTSGHSDLHEQSISRIVGRSRIDFVWLKGAIQPKYAQAFADGVKQSMAQKRASV